MSIPRRKDLEPQEPKPAPSPSPSDFETYEALRLTMMLDSSEGSIPLGYDLDIVKGDSFAESDGSFIVRVGNRTITVALSRIIYREMHPTSAVRPKKRES